MAFIIAAVNIAGVVVFATLLWNSRARIAGLAGFGLALVPFLLSFFGPERIDSGSAWVLVFQLEGTLRITSVVLLLGAVYALRDCPSLRSAVMESQLARIVAVPLMIALALGSIVREGVFFHASDFAVTVIALLALYGTLVRWGATPTGLAGAVGFGIMALTSALYIFVVVFRVGFERFVSPNVFNVLHVLGPAAIVAGFALASRQPGIERTPYPGATAVGMTGARWVGFVFVLVGCVLFVLLGHAIGERHILKGIPSGRAAVFAALLPLYLALIGVVRLTTGQPVWPFMKWSEGKKNTCPAENPT